MPTCGVWPKARGFHAAIADEDGRRCEDFTVERNDDARWDLLARLQAHHGVDVELVVPEVLSKDALVRFALGRGVVVWIVPHVLLEAMLTAAGLTARTPKRAALLLARMSLHQTLQRQMRRLGQLQLL